MLHYIVPPILGGIIGLVTNGIAIRMLFRPFRPIFFGKYQLPFTPGLIPKEKPRIAKAIGQVVGANLLDEETLTKALASDKIRLALDEKIDKIIDGLRTEERSLQECVAELGYEDTLDHGVAYVGNHLGVYVAEKLVENQVGTELFEFVLQQLIMNLNPMFVVIAESAIEKSKEEILDKLDEMILEQAPGIVDGYLEREYGNWMEKPVNEFAAGLWQKKEVLKDRIWELYLMILEKNSGSFFRNLNVSEIVEDKIREFDAEELEKLILDIARKELNSLVWIGGLLGTLIGFANLLF